MTGSDLHPNKFGSSTSTEHQNSGNHMTLGQPKLLKTQRLPKCRSQLVPSLVK